jgi:hypothetical protein
VPDAKGELQTRASHSSAGLGEELKMRRGPHSALAEGRAGSQGIVF